MARYARICSNKNNWVYPDLSIKPDTHLSHPGKYGFGFDEWLNSPNLRVNSNILNGNTEKIIDLDNSVNDIQIGFIQAYQKKSPPFNDDIELFIKVQKMNYIVGSIKSCHRLSLNQASNILNYFNQNGEINNMANIISRVNQKYPRPYSLPFPDLQNPLNNFNCYFKVSDLSFYSTPILVNKGHRYNNLYY